MIIFVKNVGVSYSSSYFVFFFMSIEKIKNIISIKNKEEKTKVISYRYSHMYSMIGVYLGALLLAGTFTLMPGRIIHRLFFG